jgi:hypothetical protein
MTRWIDFDGRKLTLTDWAKVAGITPGNLHYRLKHSWPLNRALAPKQRCD